MATLEGLYQRLACNQASREPTLEVLSGEKFLLWQAADAHIACGLFRDEPSADTIVTDVSNITSARIIIRKNNVRGDVLVDKTITSGFTNCTWDQWNVGAGQHFTFDLTEVQTNWPVLASGILPIHFTIVVQTGTSTYIPAHGYGQIVDVGLVNNVEPIPPNYLAVYVDGDGLVKNSGIVNFGPNQLQIGGSTVLSQSAADARYFQLANLNYIDARLYGLDVTGAISGTIPTDNDTALANARAAARTAKLPLFLAGPFSITQPIVITDPAEQWFGNALGDTNNSLGASTGTLGTRIIWRGAAGATMMTISCIYRGVKIQDIEFDGQLIAGDCLVLDSSEFGYLQNIRVARWTTGSGLILRGGVRNTQWNTLIGFTINATGNGGPCMLMDGDILGTLGGGDATLNTLSQFQITQSITTSTSNRDGLVLRNCDNNSFSDFWIYQSLSTGYGVRVDPVSSPSSPTTTRPAANVFHHLHCGSGGWYQPAGTLTIPAVIFGYQRDSGINPPITNGTPLYYTDGFGNTAWTATTLTQPRTSTTPWITLNTTGVNNLDQYGGKIQWYDTASSNEQAAIASRTEASAGGGLTFWTKNGTGSAGSATQKMRLWGSGGLHLGTTFTDPGAGSMRLEGFLGLSNQTAPATPTTSGRIFFDTSNRFSWKGTNGFVRTFDGAANTADRVYTLPDVAGTIALTASPTFTGLTTLTNASDPVLYVARISQAGLGLVRVAKVEAGVTDGDGALINFSAASTDGFGPMIGGLRQSSGGLASFVVRTGGNAQATAFQVWNSHGVSVGVAGTDPGANNLGVVGALSLGTPLAIANGGTGQITAALGLAALGGAPLASPTFTGNVAMAQLDVIGAGSIPFSLIRNSQTGLGIVRVAKFQAGLNDGDGALINFPTAGTDGYGPMIGGVREAAGGLGSFIVQTGANTQSTAFRVWNSHGTSVGVGGTDPGADNLGVVGKIIAGNTVRLKGYTVATLPSGTVGDVAYVTDATTPTFNGTLTGGGAVVIVVFYNGTAWVSI
jgi:hypothetical protein